MHDAPRDPDAARRLATRIGGRGPDLVVEAVGRPETWRLAVEAVRPGGDVLLHGGCPPGLTVTLPTAPLHYSEITLRGSFHHTPDVFRDALAMLADGRIDPSEFLEEPIGLDEVAAVLVASPGVKHPVMPRALT